MDLQSKGNEGNHRSSGWFRRYLKRFAITLAAMAVVSLVLNVASKTASLVGSALWSLRVVNPQVEKTIKKFDFPGVMHVAWDQQLAAFYSKVNTNRTNRARVLTTPTATPGATSLVCIIVCPGQPL